MTDPEFDGSETFVIFVLEVALLYGFTRYFAPL